MQRIVSVFPRVATSTNPLHRDDRLAGMNIVREQCWQPPPDVLESVLVGVGETNRRGGCPFVLDVLLLVCGIGLAAAVPAAGQNVSRASSVSEFARLAEKVVSDRAGGVEEPEGIEEQALEILDGVALGSLNAAAPDLSALNQHLAEFVTHDPPVGEEYEVFRLSGNPMSFALLADFGEGGPSAVRIYSGPPGKRTLAGRVDRYSQKGFLDAPTPSRREYSRRGILTVIA
jgi:hypothetical protein